MNVYLMIILIALIGEFLLQNIINYLNLRALTTSLPEEFKGFYGEDEYRKSQEYITAQTRFDYVLSAFDILLLLSFILLGGFNYVDKFVRMFNFGPIVTGLMFFGVLFFARDIISTPFSLYSNFVIEEKFGFNKMTLKIYLLDKLKGYFLVIILGPFVVGGILLFFEKLGTHAWLYAWAFLSFVIIVAQPFYTMIIAPMFNKFAHLEDGELKKAIEQYAKKVNFPLKEVRVMDGSRRSAHSNAYFSGIGKKRIALYDTLIEKHSPDELVAVIAHEVGHYKKRHILKGMLISIIHIGILFCLLSFFINNKGLLAAFRMEHISIYAGFVFFLLLYSPIELLFSIIMNHISRKYEYEADRFVAETTSSINAMVLALKNLSVANLGNLTPHPLNVFLNYNHPPVLERIKALRSLNIRHGLDKSL